MKIAMKSPRYPNELGNAGRCFARQYESHGLFYIWKKKNKSYMVKFLLLVANLRFTPRSNNMGKFLQISSISQSR